MVINAHSCFVVPQHRRVCVCFCVQRWTSRVWSSPLARRTASTASAMARRKTTTASRAAPATPATQAHIPTDYSRTTVRTPHGHLCPIQLRRPSFPALTICEPHYLHWLTPQRQYTPIRSPLFPARALLEGCRADVPLKPSRLPPLTTDPTSVLLH